ncbi:serine/threonine-protein kinase [Nonomuraea sp. NEAU-A123]|uniref:serine/threonine-protein kinase n=1 Tax=Nonomuraea sp. NEAU-A123 TaxID=2839649 RepID=UPI001BE49010|nr:serine/threonine-protein kinase [Nonomuraea sp. NEAU-A123]MBT2232957.1 serine/threonine protein kinase [Nonomuraea sp. NEAU-A123]
MEPLLPEDPGAVGPYRLVGRLGEGGQGVVYLAEAPSGGPVAVKVLQDGLAGDDRFAKEVAAARRVEPFCIAQVLDASLGGRPYIVTEYVDGPSLQQAGRHTGGDLQRLAVATATALAAIHAAGIVHRDFKPANVLLGRDGPRVIDFGIARATDSALTVTSSIVGTPAYMAPEQLAGAAVGPAADVFAWASVIVYAAGGEPPFGQDALPAVISRILNNEPQLGNLPGSLRPIVYACLSKDPTRRPTMQDVLLGLLGGHSSGTTDPGPGFPGSGAHGPPSPGHGTQPGGPAGHGSPGGPGHGTQPRGPVPVGGGQGTQPGRRVAGHGHGVEQRQAAGRGRLLVPLLAGGGSVAIMASIATAVTLTFPPGVGTQPPAAALTSGVSTSEAGVPTADGTLSKRPRPRKTTRKATPKPSATSSATPTVKPTAKPTSSPERTTPTPTRTTKKPAATRANLSILAIRAMGAHPTNGCLMPPVNFDTQVETDKTPAGEYGTLKYNFAWVVDSKTVMRRQGLIGHGEYTSWEGSLGYMVSAGTHTVTFKLTSPVVKSRSTSFTVCSIED